MLSIPSIRAFLIILCSVSHLGCEGYVSTCLGGVVVFSKDKISLTAAAFFCCFFFGWVQKWLYSKPFPAG